MLNYTKGPYDVLIASSAPSALRLMFQASIAPSMLSESTLLAQVSSISCATATANGSEVEHHGNLIG